MYLTNLLLSLGGWEHITPNCIINRVQPNLRYKSANMLNGICLPIILLKHKCLLVIR